MELDLPNDPEREFVVSIDTAHVRASRAEAGESFEIAVARCGRGARFASGSLFHDRRHVEARASIPDVAALQSEGYAGRGEVTVLSDGAEIMKRLPRALPQPTTHIIDWFHIAMKIQPLQQVADHVVRWRRAANDEMANVDADIRSLRWKLWHGQIDRVVGQLERMTNEFAALREKGDLSATALHLAQPLLTYVRSNQNAIVDYGARFRSGRRIASALAEFAVNSLVARRMVKKQQMQWSKRGAHLSASGSRGRSQRRSSGAPRLQTANRPTDRGLRGCSSRRRPCSRRRGTPVNLALPSSIFSTQDGS